jgi:pimeloyl-ACP methyl ester carboxylesterase
VDGGELAFEVLPGSTPPVLAIHGISSQRKLWNWLHLVAPTFSLIAPDLRGRADSIDVTGPSSIGRHVADLIALLDRLEVDRVHVCGMSMGGFVGVELAVAHPGRVDSLTLIDGGFPMPTPPGLTPEALPAVFADRLARLDQQWESVQEYLDFFVANTAPLLDPADPLLRDYLAHDLRDGLVRLSSAALLDDARDVYFGDNHWEQITVPIRFLHAEWGAGPGAPPGYPAETVAQFRPATVHTAFVEGVDHAGSIMTQKGAKATAKLLAEAVG